MLGDLGADVVRIERVDGDHTRHSLPARNPGMSGLVMGLFRNKRSVALDLKQEPGLDAARRLIATADVLVTNMRQAALARLGLDDATLRAGHGALIYCVANGFGSDGPYADRVAYDDVIQAASGLAWLAGKVGDAPAYVPSVIADKVSALTIVEAVLAALFHRERSGEGQFIEVPMFETMVAFNLVEHLRGQTFEPPVGGFGYRRLMTPLRRPFHTADGWICLLPYSDRNFVDFFTFAGQPLLASDARFSDHNARIHNVDALYEVIEQIAIERTTEEWLVFCGEHSIAAMNVLDLSAAEDDPHLAATGLIEHVDHPTEGRYRHVRDAVRYSRTPTSLRRHAPHLGEHTAELLTEIGYSESEIDALVAAGAAASA